MKVLPLFALLLIASVAVVASLPLDTPVHAYADALNTDRLRYDGQSVVHAIIDTVQKATLVENLGLDVWLRNADGVWDVRVTGEQHSLLQSHGVVTTEFIRDLQATIEATQPKEPVMTNADAFFNDYRRYDDIIAFYKQRAAQYPNLVVKTVVIGKSIEGRDIYAFHLRGRASGAKKLFWQGGLHAREWICPPTVTFQFEQLLSLYGKDADATFILDTFEIIIVPVANPDGYEYSHTRDRMWRKNRRVNSGSTCIGVDLNRNWDAKWAQGGSSSSPCSDTYHGTGPFSEPESRLVSSYYLAQGKIDAAIDFHSYTQLILRPYGYTRVDAPDEKHMKALGDGMSNAILPVHGKAYTSQKSIDLYVTTGTTGDWFYVGTNNYSWSYTFELRDTGRYGFLLPADQIVPQGEEIWAAMKYFAKYVAANHP